MEAIITKNNKKRYLDEKVVRKFFDDYNDKYLGVKKLTYIQFKNRVKSFMITEDMTTLQAVKKSVRMTDYTSYNTLAKENMLNAIKEHHPDVYATARNLSRWGKGQGHSAGAFRSLADNITYDAQTRQYYITSSRGVQWYFVWESSPEILRLQDTKGNIYGGM